MRNKVYFKSFFDLIVYFEIYMKDLEPKIDFKIFDKDLINHRINSCLQSTSILV
jgi:hypothetical protein